MTDSPAVSAPSAGATLCSLFLGQVFGQVFGRAGGDAGRTAVTLGGECWSYGDLERRSAAVARRLRALGIERGEPVGLAVDRSFEMVAGLLGALRAGGAYVPLDPGYPEERLAFMWRDCGARVLLTRTGLAGELPAGLTSGASVLLLDDVEEAADGAAPDAEIGPDDLAYVIYTSGSTGRPKGVMVEHRGAVRVVEENARLLAVTPESRVIQLASLSFDASVLEIFTALATGAELALTPRETLLSGEALGEELRTRRITTLAIPPSLLDKVPEGVELPDLESIVVGGETCSAATAARWAPGRRFYNAYAPTEATIYITAHRYEAPFDGTAGGPPIGRPISGGIVRVLGPDLRPVAADESGELCLGGVGLTRGYLGRPALTAERYVPDPEATEEDPGARLYRSGDLGRRLPGGALTFHGRADHQVKVRGVRIELGEIEAVLTEHPDVRSAVVDLRSGEGGGDARGGDDDRLIAYVVPRDGAGPTAGALRRFLADRLPEAMLPQAFVTLDALPMAPTGKVDRRALPDPGGDRPELDTEYAAPRGETEEALAAIWGELLGVDRVGRHDDLFALGGHSLVVTQIAGRVREDLEREVPLLVIFEHPTVAGLAAWLEAPEATAGEAVEGVEPDELPPIRPVPRDGRPLPVSFPQERVWFLIQLAPHAIAYNFQFSIRFRGGLEIERLRRALTGVVERHEVLRTTFPAVDGRPVQEIHPPYEVDLPRIDLTALPPERRQPEAERWVRREIRRGFDVLTLPLFRTRVFELAADDHLFLQVEHHFIHDGWSLAVYLRDLQALYRGEILPPLPVQYADFAAWQHDWMEGPAFERQLAYWRRALAPDESGGLPELPVLALPTDRPRPRAHEFRGEALRVDMPGELYAGIRRFGREQGMTLFMTMLSAFYTLMHRYTGQEDVLLGSGLANRRLRETEALVGMVVNTVVLRERPEAGISFRQLLERVRSTTLEAHLHQDTPFERLVQEIQPERDLSGNPIFQVLFSFHDAAVPDLEMPELGLTGDLWEWHNGSAKSDLNVVVKPMAEQRVGRKARGDELLTMVWELSTAILDRGTVERMWGHYQVILRGAIEDPSRPLAALPLLTEAERVQIRAWGDGPAPARETVEPVPLRVLRRARENPGVPAVVTAESTLTYGELAARAGALARKLTDLPGWRLGREGGQESEPVVATLTGRSPETAIAALAVTAAGGAYLPIDPDYPAERIAHLLADSGAVAVVAREDLADRLPESTPPVLDASAAEGEALVPDRLAALHPDLDGERLAYVIYTSGSTGRPKGVELTHRGLANLVAWHLDAYRWDPGGEERATLLAGPGFDAAVWELWPALSAGAALHVPPAALRSDPEKLLAWLADEGITLTFLATPLAEAVLDSIRARGVPEGLRLRALLTGGDRLHRPPPEGLPFALVNHYGPTESTVVATAGAVSPGERTPPPIGRPIAGLGARVLDRNGREVPAGVPGQLYVADLGARSSLARGYRGRPAWTAEAFLPDPDAAVPGARIYRTGDLARWLADGRIEFLGRIDHQVQVRGFRVELGEIESVLAEHPGVGEAVVVAVTGNGRTSESDTRLVAYVTPAGPGGQGEDAPTADALAGWAGERLADYMVPWRFVAIPEIPLTPNGKVDRRALPAPEVSDPNRGERVAPRDPAEELVAGIWAGVLGIDTPGVHDDFFHLGGHSLLATRVLSRLRDATGVDVPLAELFGGPTVAELAARMAGGEAGDDRGGIEPVDRDGPLPLSFTQERLWFLDRLAPGTAAYVIGRGYRIDGPLDPAALAGALSDVVERHEALRTRFVTSDDGSGDEAPVQVVDAPEPVPVPVIDLSGLDGEEAAAEARRLAVAHAARPFDLAAGPVLRSALVRLDRRIDRAMHRWLVAMHHIVSDGWSMEIFHREVGTRYAARTGAGSGGLPELPFLSIQYPDFAAWQRRRLRGEALERLLGYWRDHLAGAPGTLDLPLDRPRPAVQRFRGAEVAATLPAEPAAALDRLAREAGATRFMALLAGFAALLARYSHAGDVVVGTPVACRTRSEVQPLIGFFVNTLPLRLALAPGAGFRDLLAVARRATLAGHAHQELPFEKLVEELSPERHLSHSPLFQVLLGVQEAALSAPELAGAETGVMPVERHEARFDLELSVTGLSSEGGGGLALRLRYDRDLFERATARRMAEHLGRLLAAAAAAPDAPWTALPLLSEAERAEVLRAGHGPELPSELPGGEAPGAGLHHAVERQAERTPEAEALVWNRERLTYRELVDRAGRLAAHLADRPDGRAIGPKDRVGVFLPRTPDLIVTLLAVLRAGATYVPLDPEYPRTRLEEILEDTAAALVVTTSDLADRLPVADDRLLRLDRPDGEREAIAARSPAPPAPVDPEALAYVIYTSGSTGRPKGVAIPHRAARALLAWGGTVFGPDDLSGVLATTSVCFDLSVFEIFVTLASGGRVILADSVLALPELPARDEVTLINTVPSAMAELVAAEAVPSGVRTVNLAGEPLRRELADRLYGLGIERVHDLYGPSEDTTYSTFARREPGGPETIGRPVAGTRAHLVDSLLEPVPPGVTGELVLGGGGLARGYLNRPRETAERFVPDPRAPPTPRSPSLPQGGQGTPPPDGLQNVGGGRIYRTGDLARRMDDGDLRFLGRIDHQVKLRGFRIELGEIEAALEALPAVREAVALVAGEEEGRRLVAFVVPAAGESEPDPATLREDLARTLPGYMVPGALHRLEALPRLPNGKIDRARLAEIATREAAPGDGSGAGEPVPPETDTERAVAAIWCEVLGREEIGVRDDFFGIGGHSLLATRIMGRVRRRLGADLPLRALFQHPTIRALAEAVDGARRDGADGEIQKPAIQKVARRRRHRSDVGS